MQSWSIRIQQPPDAPEPCRTIRVTAPGLTSAIAAAQHRLQGADRFIISNVS